MRPLTKILAYLLVVVLLAAVLSPPIYWLGQWLGGQGIFPALAGFPFRRFFSRTAQVTAIALLVPLLLWLRIRSVKEFGLSQNPHRLRDLLAGLLFALVPVVLLGAGYLFFEVYGWKKELNFAPLLRIVLTAGFVAVVEEWLFRGVLLGLAVRAFGTWTGVLSVSAVFAGIHFITPASSPDGSVGWGTGFAQIARVFDSAPPFASLALGFLSLFVAGLILALAALRTRSLWLPIGLHAGWILGQQSLQLLAKYRIKPADELLPWIGPNVVSGAVPVGLVPVFVLLLTGAAVWFYLRHASRPEGLRSP